MASGTRLVVVGRITAPHGVRGEVKLQSFTARPEDIASYGPLTTASDETIEIVALRRSGPGFIARLKGIGSRTAAEALRGQQLGVSRDALPQPDSDEFYHSDLIGVDAFSLEGRMLGSVVAVRNWGAGDLLEIRSTQGNKSILVPFTTRCVPEIDLANRRLVADPPQIDEQAAGDPQ